MTDTQQSAHNQPVPGRRIAVCSWSLQPPNPAALIEALSRTGINAVSLAMSPLVNDPQTWAGAIDTLRSCGITIVSGMMATLGEDYSTLQSIALTGGIRPDTTWPHNLAHASALADLAAEAHVRLITFHAGFLPESPHDPERATIMDRLCHLADLFAQYKIDIALETGQESAETLEHVLSDLNRANLGVNFDPANMILYGMGDPIAALRRLGPHVRQVHIKDAIASRTSGEWGAEVPIGEGQVHWRAFFAALAELARPIDLVIEREAGDQRIKDIQTAAHLITEQLRS